MDQILSKEIVNRFMGFKGEVRGVLLKNYAEFVLKREGEDGLKKIEDELMEIGYPIKYSELSTMSFYPIGFQAITIAAMRKVLNYDDKTFYELGGFQPKISFIVKLFMKYFISLDIMAKKVPDIWKRYYSVGNLEVAELNKEKKYIILRLKDFPCNPLQCQQTIRGYLPSIVQMIIKSETTCEETKCPFKGDEYHEYLMKW